MQIDDKVFLGLLAGAGTTVGAIVRYLYAGSLADKTALLVEVRAERDRCIKERDEMCEDLEAERERGHKERVEAQAALNESAGRERELRGASQAQLARIAQLEAALAAKERQ